MTKYAPHTSSSALKRARAKIGKSNKVGMCAEEVIVNILGIPGPWKWGGNGKPYAVNYFLGAQKVVHTSDPMKIPAGSIPIWGPRPGATTAGGKAGHIAVGDGGGYCNTTDLPHEGKWGRVKISEVTRLWGKPLIGYVLVDGMGYTLTDPPAPAKTEVAFAPLDANWVVTASLLNGRTQPVDGKVRYQRKAGYKLHTTGTATVNGAQWVRTRFGTWYAAAHLKAADTPATPAPAPAPVVTKPTSVTMRLLTINISRYRVGTTDVRGTFSKGLNYAQRIPYIEKIRDKARASMVLTQESGPYAAGKALAKAFPAAFRHFLHGDNGDITQAIHWGSDARKLLYEGSAPIGGGRYVVWGIFEDIASGIEFEVGNLHPDYVRGNDELRRSQTAAALKVMEAKADGRPQILGGDLNDDKDDAFDGPGRALKAAGFRDTEVEAATKKNLDKGTLNGLTPGLQAGRRYDRFWVKDGENHTVKVNEIDTLDGYPATDHNAVVISVTITAK